MEIKFEKEEVMAIIINHVKLLGGWIHDKDVTGIESYGDFKVSITNKIPEHSREDEGRDEDGK